jgi:hypothetical protein
MARFLELHAETLLHGPDDKGKGKGKAVLELGAGGGLPGLTAALEGAGNVRSFFFPFFRSADLVVSRLSSPTFPTPPSSRTSRRTSS